MDVRVTSVEGDFIFFYADDMEGDAKIAENGIVYDLDIINPPFISLPNWASRTILEKLQAHLDGVNNE